VALSGCQKNSGVAVNGKQLSNGDVEASEGDLKEVFTADPKNLKGVATKTEMGKVLKEMMLSAAEIEKDHEAKLAKISLDELLTEKQFRSQASLEKGIREMDEMAKIETEFVEKKIALSERFKDAVDAPGFREGLEKSRTKLQILLKKELAFADANRKYLSFGLKVRPSVGEGHIYWPEQYLKQGDALEKDAAAKLEAMASYAEEMETGLQQSKDTFLNEANKLP